MTDDNPSNEIPINDRALNKLIRAITLSQGNFSLILVRCNYGSLRDHIVEMLKVQCPTPIHQLHLPTTTKTLYTTIQNELGHEHPEALMIFGLDRVVAVEQVLISTNQVREEFRKNFLFPIVLWVNDDTLKRIIQRMPDFKSWTGNSIKFEIAKTELAENISHLFDALFESLFDVGEGKFLEMEALHPQGDYWSGELQSALEDFQVLVADSLQASLQFWVGREADLRGQKAEAKTHYEKSLEFWTEQISCPEGLSSDDWARYGCVQFHLGLWWRQYAIQHRAEYEAACLQAKNCYQKSLAAFDRTERPELVAKFINPLGEVMARMGQWDELATVAQRAVQLHRNYPEPIRLAFAYGLLAEAALQQKDWVTVKTQAELALQTNELPSRSSIDWSLDCAQRKNLYLFLLAQAQYHLKQHEQAIANLETAKANFEPQYDPSSYIRILEALRSLYFEQGQYLQAFETKQEQRSIEQQYGLRAFVGAVRLQSRRQVINPGLAATDGKEAEMQEIAASGRLLDVNRLLERIGRNDHKLTVIYGQSGVGKSSLVQAGVIPALKRHSIEARDVMPVLLQVYTDWVQNLGERLSESLQEVRGLNLTLFLDSMSAFVAELQKNGDKNLWTVLIFDQFEEFFFAYKDPANRRPFFEFLRDCLNVPYVKVILSLREDYLHYLLECNRLTHLDIIDNNILDKKILYYLGNFSPEDGRAVIQSLTNACRFSLEPALIDELVRDLAGDLNEVRPIELQVVGAQMQTEHVTNLSQYLEGGPKERFVGRFLEEVVIDCGKQNEQFTKIILYLLTDDNLTRPLKTLTELEADLAIDRERLELILNILVKSGLVFKVPGFPTDRYQLVHDYLVPFVRQQQSAGLVAELEKEKEQRKLTEEKLNKALKQQLVTARRGIYTLLGLTVAIGGFAIVAIVAGINLYISNQVEVSSKNQELDRLVSAIKFSKTLRAFPVAIREIKLPAMIEMNNAIANSREQNRLEGHTGAVTQVVFSPDGKLIASISEDKTAKVWRVEDGKLLQSLLGDQSKEITSVSFSNDGQKIAIGSYEEVIVWTLDGQRLNTLPTQSNVTSISFSNDDKTLATSVGNDVIFWNLVTSKQNNNIYKGDAEITTVRYNPTGDMIAIADKFDKVRILKTKENKNDILIKFDNYGTLDIRFDRDMLVLASKDGSTKYYNSDGNLIKKVEGRNDGVEDYISISSLSQNSKLLASTTKRNYSIELRRQDFNSNVDESSTRRFSSGHTQEITSLSFSPDGRTLASASKDSTIRLWDVNIKSKLELTEADRIQKIRFRDNQTIVASLSNKTVQLFDQQLKPLQILKKNVYGLVLSFSPDGQKILTQSSDDKLKLWRVGEQELNLTVSSNGIKNVVLSPNGKIVVSIENDNTLSFFENNGKLIKLPHQLDTEIKKIMFSPNSELVALLEKNKVQIWRNDGTHITDLSGHINQINEVSFSPDSELITTSGDDNLIHLWHNENGNWIYNLLPHKNTPEGQVKFSPNSEIIASFSQGSRNYGGAGRGEIKLWTRDGISVNTLIGYQIQELNFSQDNQKIAVINNDKTIQLSDIVGNLNLTLSHDGTVRSISFSPDGKLLASASQDSTIRLWDLDGKLIKPPLRGHSSGVSQVKFNPINGQSIVSVGDDGMVQMWNLYGDKYTRQMLQPAEKEDERNGWANNSIEFSDDGKLVIFIRSRYVFLNGIYQMRTIAAKIWSSDGQPLKHPQGQHDFNNLTYSSDGKNIAWVDHDKALKLIDLQGSSPIIFSGHSDTVNSVSFSQNGKLLASTSDDKTVRLWNTLDGQLLKIFNLNDKGTLVKFSPVSEILAIVSKEKLKLLNREGEEIKPSLTTSDNITDIQFSHDGQVLTSNGSSNTTLWQMSDGKRNQLSVNGYFNAFSSDNSMLAIAEYNSDIRFYLLGGLWNSPSSVFSTQVRLTDMQFSPDGKIMILTTQGNQTLIVDFDLDRLLSKACKLTRNYLQNNQKLSDSDRHICDDIK
jgi:WD40 repeat protein/tetratricopeptide (TPR) repeat protein